MKPTEPDVTIIIPHHNGPDLLRASIGSLEELRYRRGGWRVVVVADAPTDDSVAVLRREFPDVTVIDIETNLGFAGTCNRGAQAADTEWIAFLNNDTRVDPGWLNGLVTAVDPAAGILAAGSKILDWTGHAVTFQGGHLNFVGKGFEDSCAKGSADERTEPRDLLFATGCGMLVRRDTFLGLGGFDAQFFGFYEDSDFGWRMRLGGYQTRFAPESIVYHRGHASFDTAGAHRRLAYIERNALWQVMKNLGDEAYRRILPAALFLAIRRSEILEKGFVHGRRRQVSDAVQSLLQGGPVKGYGKTTLAAYAGMIDGMADILRKREKVQKMRKVGDDAILTKEFFPDPFRPWALDAMMEAGLSQGEYPAVMRRIVETFGVQEVFPYAPLPSV